uniref:Uncharacterized protein n=1 Tax=Mycolicibacterium gilvum (strain PYR-GCK) TaxID=350054 RepID=A4T1D7_MYCGI|nr:conserved hypothetical protein [Mycolicibacterium gilvum PYR-GCK]
MHFTSVCRHPVFVDGKNYSGAPPLLTTRILREEVEATFVPEVASLRHSIFVPLGTQVSDAVEFAAVQTVLDRNRVLTGLPHPSGATPKGSPFSLAVSPESRFRTRSTRIGLLPLGRS